MRSLFSGSSDAGGVAAQAPPRMQDAFSACELFVIDTRTGRLTRGLCASVGRERVRLTLPADAALEVGRHYEICSQRPGQGSPPGGVCCQSRGATLVRFDVLSAAGFGPVAATVDFRLDTLTDDDE